MNCFIKKIHFYSISQEQFTGLEINYSTIQKSLKILEYLSQLQTPQIYHLKIFISRVQIQQNYMHTSSHNLRQLNALQYCSFMAMLATQGTDCQTSKDFSNICKPTCSLWNTEDMASLKAILLNQDYTKMHKLPLIIYLTDKIQIIGGFLFLGDRQVRHSKMIESYQFSCKSLFLVSRRCCCYRPSFANVQF